MPTLMLSKKEVRRLINIRDVIDVVEAGFKDYTEGKGEMPSKVYLTVKDGDFRAMPASLPGEAGMKWVSVHTGNMAKGLPTVMAVLIFNDPDTGYPLGNHGRLRNNGVTDSSDLHHCIKIPGA